MRLLYALRDTPDWELFLGFLLQFNRAGAENSTLLAPGKAREIPCVSHSFDCGSAWACFALQVQMLGYRTHGMVGFDMDTAFAALHVPIGYRIEIMAAVGRQGNPSSLLDALREREAPNTRHAVETFAFAGGFAT